MVGTTRCLDSIPLHSTLPPKRTTNSIRNNIISFISYHFFEAHDQVTNVPPASQGQHSNSQGTCILASKELEAMRQLSGVCPDSDASWPPSRNRIRLGPMLFDCKWQYQLPVSVSDFQKKMVWKSKGLLSGLRKQSTLYYTTLYKWIGSFLSELERLQILTSELK